MSPSSSAAEPRQSQYTRNQEQSSKSLLIIEDDLSIIDFLETVLDNIRPGLEWDYATTGEQGLQLIQDRSKAGFSPPYDLVIADIFLGGELTGFDSWLECLEEFPHMPFVMTSSISVDRYLSILNGFAQSPSYLPKPLTVGSCRNVLEEYI
ncbi:MAG: response regulator [Bdellovibrionales bacterium]